MDNSKIYKLRMVKQNTHFDKVKHPKIMKCFCCFLVSSISEKLSDGRDLESSNVAEF